MQIQGSPRRQAGEWVLVEAGGRLLSIGESVYQGQSSRAYLDSVGRRYLLPLLAKVSQSKAPATESRQCADGQVVRVEAVPIIGPSGCIHAIAGGYSTQTAVLGQRPEIGAWEWDWPARRTYWTREQFRLYGFSEPPNGRLWWSADEWIELTETGGFPRLMEVFGRFKIAHPEELNIHSFRTPRADTGSVQQLRLAGRTLTDDQGAPRWFRGVTTRVESYQPHADSQFQEQQYLDAAMALNTNPVCVVDIGEDRLLLRNTPMRDSGVEFPSDHSLSQAVHPDDLCYFKGFLNTAPIAPAPNPPSTTVRFAKSGGWAHMSVSAIRLLNKTDSLHVMLRLLPAF